MSEQSQGHDDKGDKKIRKDIDLFGYAKHGSDSEWDKVKPLIKGRELYTRLLIRKLSKPICQYTLDGEFVREWKSATEAARALGCCYVGIGNCCRGTKKTCHGFLWRFKNTDESTTPT